MPKAYASGGEELVKGSPVRLDETTAKSLGLEPFEGVVVRVTGTGHVRVKQNKTGQIWHGPESMWNYWEVCPDCEETDHSGVCGCAHCGRLGCDSCQAGGLCMDCDVDEMSRQDGEDDDDGWDDEDE